MTSYTLLFPGQGSQYVGMGKSVFSDPVGKQLLEEAQEYLSIPLKRFMLEGPADKLRSTEIAQPAILLHSVAVFLIIKQKINFNVSCALGHSLGEYSALVAAKVMSFKDAIKTVHIRGKYMQEAVPVGQGAMVAVLGLDVNKVILAMQEFSDENSAEYASCANFNEPNQTIIAGTKTGVLKASEKLKSLGAKRIIELQVSAPFHCALMKPVQKKMAEVLSVIPFKNPEFPIISNVSAQKEIQGEKIRKLLLMQITSPVKFTDCVIRVREKKLGGDGFLELGPKNILSGLIKKIEKESVVLNVDTIEDIFQLR
jgi:[acyl-carrier-protein] S-malonyltransferase